MSWRYDISLRRDDTTQGLVLVENNLMRQNHLKQMPKLSNYRQSLLTIAVTLSCGVLPEKPVHKGTDLRVFGVCSFKNMKTVVSQNN